MRGAAETVAVIGAAGGVAAAFTVDVTDPDATEALARDVVARFGTIDVLFNNAGIAGVGLLHETSVELWDRVMAVNVRGVFLVATRGPADDDRAPVGARSSTCPRRSPRSAS